MANDNNENSYWDLSVFGIPPTEENIHKDAMQRLKSDIVSEEKAHDNINKLIDDSEYKDLAMNLAMGIGGGGLGRTGSNIIQKILSKIKGRNARGLRNLREGQGTGAQSMSSSDRGFLNKEWDVWNKLKDSLK